MRANFLGPATTVVFALSASAAQPGEIIVTGARLPNDRASFVWTVTNNSSTPITMFRAPYCRGTIAEPDNGWAERSPTGPLRGDHNAGARILEVASVSAATGIKPGQTRRFRLWDPRKRGIVARQSVTVGLADGAEVVIAGVPCPAPESYLRRNFPLIGLGAIFALFLVFKALRSGRKETTKPSPAG